GIPRTPDGILDMLVERQIAFLREGAAPEDRLWKIAPACLAAKIPDIKLYAIRLRDDAMVSSVPIPPIEGRIIDDTAQTDSVEHPPTADEEAPAAQQADETGGPADERAFAETQKAAAHPQRPSATVPARGKQKAKSGVKLPSSSPRLREGQSHGGQADDISLDGPAGEALKALLQDLAAGAKSWGRDALVAALAGRIRGLRVDAQGDTGRTHSQRVAVDRPVGAAEEGARGHLRSGVGQVHSPDANDQQSTDRKQARAGAATRR
ncbi:hypothetical protein U6O65_12320, partial [Cutibacterium acnes]